MLDVHQCILLAREGCLHTHEATVEASTGCKSCNKGLTCVALQGGLRLTPGAFFSNWFATMLVTLVAQSFGLLIGATVMNAKTAQTVTAVVMLTMMLGACFQVMCVRPVTRHAMSLPVRRPVFSLLAPLLPLKKDHHGWLSDRMMCF